MLITPLVFCETFNKISQNLKINNLGKYLQTYAKLKQSGIRLASASCIIKLDEFKEEIVALLRNGSSKKFVADRYGTSQVNLYNWIKKNNIDLCSQNI